MKSNCNQIVNHSLKFSGPLKAYCVHVRNNKSLHYTFIAVADSPKNAIKAVRSNAQAVIEQVRSECKPEDFVKHDIIENPSIRDGQQANCLEVEIKDMQEKLIEIEDFTDAMSQTHRETLVASIKEAHENIKLLRRPRSIGKRESLFEYTISRMANILKMKCHAEELSASRVYPVSYFDDFRSIITS